MVLIVGEFIALEFFHKIFSGSSTTVGGFGSGCDLVLILHEAIFIHSHKVQIGLENCFGLI